MSTVAKIVELSSDSNQSFDDALRTGVERARKTLDGVKGVWVKDQEVLVGDDGSMTFRIHMKVTFVMHD
jgi:hypothetical protein